MEISTTKKFYFHTRKKARKEKKFKQRTKTITMKGRKGWANRISGKAKKKKKEVIQKAL